MKFLYSILLLVCIFANLTKLNAQNTHVKLADGYYVTADEGVKVYDKSQEKTFYLDKSTWIAIKHVKSTEVKKIPDLPKLRYGLSSSLDALGTSALAKFDPQLDTTTNIGLIVNGKLLFLARLFSRITSGNLSFASNKLSKADLEKIKLEIDKAAGMKTHSK
jgi:hypothetical protein